MFHRFGDYQHRRDLESFSQPRLLLFLLTMLAAGAVVAYLGSTTTALIIGAGVGLVLLSFVPELPFVILTMGMSVWKPVEDLVAGYAIPLTLLMGLVALLLMQLRNALQKQRGVTANQSGRFVSPDILLFLFTLWVWIALTWTSSPGYGQTKALQFTATSFGAYMMLRMLYDHSSFRLRRMAWLMALAGAAHAFLVIYIIRDIGIGDLATLSARVTRQAVQLGFNSIAEADALVLGLLATTVLLIRSAGKYRLLLLIGYALQLAAFAVYQQRGATLALLASTAFVIVSLSDRAPSTIPRRVSLS
jgi:hypothetical protein